MLPIILLTLTKTLEIVETRNPYDPEARLFPNRSNFNFRSSAKGTTTIELSPEKTFSPSE